MQGMDVPEIVRALMRKLQMNQTQVAKRLGVTQPTISRWVTGEDLPDFEASKRLRAAAIEEKIVTPDHHALSATREVAIRGIVGLGEIIEWLGEGGVLELVELPFAVPDGCIALEARGDSQAPRVRNGEVVVVLFNDQSPRDLIGQEAVVRLRDGSYLLKTIRRGYDEGRFNLESFNAPLRENAEVDQVGEVWAIIPARRWRRLPQPA
jgi:transcriptional regulator with XRE-family HTH domain